MLVISRRRGQRIRIGDEIEIVVTEVHRSSVKLGIRAPRGVEIVRAEIVVSSDESPGAGAAATGEPTPDEPSPPGGASSDGEQDERDQSG